MEPIERKVAMLRKGVTMSEIAKKLNVSRPHISMVIAGRTRSPRVESAIAEAIGLPVDQVFPPPKREGAAA